MHQKTYKKKIGKPAPNGVPSSDTKCVWLIKPNTIFMRVYFPYFFSTFCYVHYIAFRLVLAGIFGDSHSRFVVVAVAVAVAGTRKWY